MRLFQEMQLSFRWRIGLEPQAVNESVKRGHTFRFRSELNGVCQ